MEVRKLVASLNLKGNYEKEYRLSKIGLDAIFEESAVDTYFEHTNNIDLIYQQLNEDLDGLRPKIAVGQNIA